LAGFDSINTMRLHRKSNQRLKSEFREALRIDKPVDEIRDE